MLKNTFLFSLFILIYSCQSFNNEPSKLLKKETAKAEILSNIYTPKNLKSQIFSINNANDTIITGNGGTMIKVYKNSFQSVDGTAIQGDVEIEIKEALTRNDIILGNLVTLSNGQLLESGGMVFVNAVANHQALKLKAGKEIGVILPTENIDSEMSVFEGVQDSFTINWVNPIKPLNEEVIELEKQTLVVNYIASKPMERLTKIEKQAMDEAVRHDSVKVGDIVDLKKFDFVVRVTQKGDVFLNPAELSGIRSTFSVDVTNLRGANFGIQDEQTAYIFSMKKLGWANIDRLFNAPNSKEIELIVNIINQEDFDFVYTTMIFSNRNIYLPGYPRVDKTYGFTHGDYEKTVLPIGEEVQILATAKKNGKSFFHIEKFEIQEKQLIEFELTEIDSAALVEKIRS